MPAGLSVDGGAGNDHFEDHGGYDTYRFGPSDGQDVLEDDFGRIQFKDGVDQNDVMFTRHGNDLIAALPTGDTVRILDWARGWSIDRFEFANGAVLSAYEVESKLNADSRSEILYGSPGTDILNGSEKNSSLYGREGDDVLRGGAGSDSLQGGAGDDVLDGGPGNDSLWGGEGNEPFDPNYHKPTDTLVHVDRTAMGINGDGVAWAVGIYAQDIGGRNGIPAREDRTRHPITE